jgi:DNA-binding response OmpR family regulator
MRLLLAEDSPRLQRSLGEGLRGAGYALDITGDGTEALWLAESNDYDAIILDIMLPGVDGLTVVQKLRAKGRMTHVLMLTARDTVEDRVRGLQAGADDYLIKPFAFEELLARVQALCRREYGRKDSRVRIGALEVDQIARTVRWSGQLVDLTALEYATVEYLALRQGQVVSRQEVEAHLYDENADPMSNVVDRTICLLRRKLAQAGAPPLISTRRGQGYLLAIEDK